MSLQSGRFCLELAGRDRANFTGVITIRNNSRLHHIGPGREHACRHVIALIADRYIRVVDAGIGDVLRDLTLDPNRD